MRVDHYGSWGPYLFAEELKRISKLLFRLNPLYLGKAFVRHKELHHRVVSLAHHLLAVVSICVEQYVDSSVM